MIFLKRTALCLLFLAGAPEARAALAVVQPGDTIWTFTERELGSSREWRRVARENGIRDPTRLTPGARLRIPAREGDRARGTVSPPIVASPDLGPPIAVAAAAPEPIAAPAAATEPVLVNTTSDAVPLPGENPAPIPPVAAERIYWGEAEIGRGTAIDLPTAVHIALEKNIPLIQGRLTPRITEATILSARSAFDPTLRHSVTRSEQELMTFQTPPPSDVRSTAHATSLTGTLPSSTQYTLTLGTTRTSSRNNSTTNRVAYAQSAVLSLTQPLLRGAGRFITTSNVEIARLNTAAAKERLPRLIENTIAATENLYFALAQAESSERIAKDSLERAKGILARNRELLRLDLIPQIDLLTAEHNVASRAATLVNAARARQNAAEALVFYVFGDSALGQLRADSYLVHTRMAPVEIPAIPSIDAAARAAVEKRREVIAARREAERNEISLRVARNTLLPTLNLTGSYGYGGTARDYRWDFNHATEIEDHNWSSGIVFSIPVGNNAAQASVQSAKLTHEQGRAEVVRLENLVQSEVRSTARDVIANRERVRLAEEAEALTQRQYELARRSLELGLIDTFRLLQHEEDAQNAENAATTARLALENAITAYHLATGGILDRHYPGGLTEPPTESIEELYASQDESPYQISRRFE